MGWDTIAGSEGQRSGSTMTPNGLVDAFRNPKLGDSSFAIESLGVALGRRKASAAVRMRADQAFRAGKAMGPYPEALTPDG